MQRVQRKTQSGENHSLAAIENSVMKNLHDPQDSKYCHCNICKGKYELRKHDKQLRNSSIQEVIPSRLKRFYEMLSAVDLKRFFKVEIPQIIFFDKNEPIAIFRSKNHGIIESVPSLALKRNLCNLFVDSNRKLMKHSLKDLPPNTDPHIKYFGQMLPSVKHGASTHEQQKARTYVFHNNSRMDGGDMILKQKDKADEIALVKCSGRSLELVNEKQLRGILKITPTSDTIEFIQAYIRPHEEHSEFTLGEYDYYKSPGDAGKFKKSEIHVKEEIGLISTYSKEYIPLEQLEGYEEMLKDIKDEYCLYMTYKMVHYIEIMRDLKIKTLETIWIQNSLNEICFYGISAFDFEENEKLQVDIEQINELKDLMKTQLTQLESELLSAWEHMKLRKITKTPQIPLSQEDLNEQQQIQQIKLQRRHRKLSTKDHQDHQLHNKID